MYTVNALLYTVHALLYTVYSLYLTDVVDVIQGLFQQPGMHHEIQQIRDCLDTGSPTQIRILAIRISVLVTGVRAPTSELVFPLATDQLAYTSLARNARATRATDSSAILAFFRESAVNDRRLAESPTNAATRITGFFWCGYTCSWVFSRRFNSALYKC